MISSSLSKSEEAKYGKLKRGTTPKLERNASICLKELTWRDIPGNKYFSIHTSWQPKRKQDGRRKE
jgi:hypothetical protein